MSSRCEEGRVKVAWEAVHAWDQGAGGVGSGSD